MRITDIFKPCRETGHNIRISEDLQWVTDGRFMLSMEDFPGALRRQAEKRADGDSPLLDRHVHAVLPDLVTCRLHEVYLVPGEIGTVVSNGQRVVQVGDQVVDANYLWILTRKGLTIWSQTGNDKALVIRNPSGSICGLLMPLVGVADARISWTAPDASAKPLPLRFAGTDQTVADPMRRNIMSNILRDCVGTQMFCSRCSATMDWKHAVHWVKTEQGKSYTECRRCAVSHITHDLAGQFYDCLDGQALEDLNVC